MYNLEARSGTGDHNCNLNSHVHGPGEFEDRGGNCCHCAHCETMMAMPRRVVAIIMIHCAEHGAASCAHSIA
jgi:hypothetical protein